MLNDCCCGYVLPVNVVGSPGQSIAGAAGANGAIVLLGQAVAANFGVAGESQITGFPSRYVITQIVVDKATQSLSPAVGGIYTGIGKTGTVLVLANHAYAPVVDSTIWHNVALAVGAQGDHAVLTGSICYLYIDTPSTVPASARVSVFGYALP